MSGIVGIINLDSAPVDRALLERMTQAMIFRGPDAQDVWLDGSVGLGHALLRTTFEAEHERGPCSLDGQVWITADARVDGRADLIRELRARGRDVADGAPDPELVLHAYHVWSDNCLEHLIGDFAFVLWDGQQKRLFCACDHFGITPFYYAQVNHCLVISNTLQVVRLHPGVSDELSERAIGDYLLFRGCQDLDTTTFADIRRLPPAHSLTWTASDGSLRMQRYWALPDCCEYLRYKNPDDYIERFREVFRQAVVDRLRTDRVSVGMSGGMDSPAVAAIAYKALEAQGKQFDLHAYTFTYTSIPNEEGHYAGLVAEALGFPIHFLDADARLRTGAPERVQALSPQLAFAFRWWFSPWVELWERTATTSRVLLMGYGGDPVLRPSSLHWIGLLKHLQPGQMIEDAQQYMRVYGHRPPLYLRVNLKRWMGQPYSRPAHPTWFNPDFAARLDLRTRLEQRTKQWNYEGLPGMAADPFWSNLMTSWDPGNTLLPFKTRFPFFDLRLVSYLISVPSVVWFVNKRLLRWAMRGILPEPVLRRSKSPLGATPIRDYIRQQGMPSWMKDLATAPELALYIDRDELLRAICAPEQARGNAYSRVLQPLALACWLRHRRSFAIPAG